MQTMNRTADKIQAQSLGTITCLHEIMDRLGRIHCVMNTGEIREAQTVINGCPNLAENTEPLDLLLWYKKSPVKRQNAAKTMYDIYCLSASFSKCENKRIVRAIEVAKTL